MVIKKSMVDKFTAVPKVKQIHQQNFNMFETGVNFQTIIHRVKPFRKWSIIAQLSCTKKSCELEGKTHKNIVRVLTNILSYLIIFELLELLLI